MKLLKHKPVVTAVIMLCVFGLTGCRQATQPALFTKIDSRHSRILFQNKIVENERINLLTNEYTYMGGGVGVGDFNNDGLVDLFFTASQSSGALYLNKGNLSFTDITRSAGLTTKSWCTGVSVIDINADGWLDIYVCVSGSLVPNERRNLLFINNHNLTFTESAADYGLNDESFSTQAVFLDYDKDGLLDMYLLTHQMYGESINRVIPKNLSGNSPRNDKLFHNEGFNPAAGHVVFKDVSMQAGIIEDGYGLGIVVSDFNNDNWPDIYVSNDYIGNDCLWLNMKNGTFKNCISQSLNHQSYSSMGTDAADINNDGLPDIATLDMMPPSNERKKMMYSLMTNTRHEMEMKLNYEPSFMANTLQLNRGVQTFNDSLVPVFSDIAHLAGVAETDWSWSILAADFDYDGFKDLHITNGMGQDLLNHDFATFSTTRSAGGPNKTLLDELKKYGPVPLSNYLFMHKGNYTFQDQSKETGIDEKSISSGAAYADMDNDGDLDMIVNNINQEAFIFANNLLQQTGDHPGHLSLRFKGPANNPNAVGARIKVFYKDKVQLYEQNPVRGYLSTVDNRIHIGLGKAGMPDSLHIIWPNDSMEVITSLKPNSVVTLSYLDAGRPPGLRAAPGRLFENYTSQSGVNFIHADSFYFDYSFQQLLPQKFSYLGPGVAVADVNKDGLEDFYAGNGFMKKGMLYLQQNNGRFTSKVLETGQKIEEDTDCLFFDADTDGDEDLLITSGTNEFPKSSPYYLPRLYLNDGKGNFSRSSDAMPASLNASTATVKACDYDKDGDLDLFLGGRIAVGNYPAPAASFILENNQGRFKDMTGEICPALQDAGMVTGACWADIDNDHREELVIAGEWMPVRIFKFNNKAFQEITKEAGLADQIGLWRSLESADLDNDGDADLVAGNIGLNNRFHFTQQFPLNLWYSDIDQNGSLDPVMAYYIQNKKGTKELYPALNLDDLASQVPSLKKKYLLHKDFSIATMQNIFRDVAGTNKLTATEAGSCWFENDGKGKFTKHELPADAQLAPVNSILVADYNQDGNKDILIAGNEYQSDVMTGRYDAGFGLVLLGTPAQKSFVPVQPSASGIFLRGDTRCLRTIKIGKSSGVIAAVNSSALQIFVPVDSQKNEKRQ